MTALSPRQIADELATLGIVPVITIEDVAAAEAHATEVREGSSGGLDASGGGCGCN